MGHSVNTSYNELDDKLKLKHSQFIQNDASKNLYATLMMTKEAEASDGNIKELLSNGKEQLSEHDKEKILYTLDYLRIKWITDNMFNDLTSDDFIRIKNHKTASNRSEELIKIVVEKAWDKLAISNEEKDGFEKDLNDHVNAIMRWRNAEVGNQVAEDISLTKLSTKRARYYWKKIKDVIEKNKNWDGSINWEKCYMDVIKYANYATLPPRKRAKNRYIIPMKFSWRNTNKQVWATLNALNKKSEESNDAKERFAINSIIKNLQWAYNYYKEKTGVDNASFDKARISNEDRIYRIAA